MITKEQALKLKDHEVLHADSSGIYNQCRNKLSKWRVNGSCRVWKRSPHRFRVPLKHGLYEYWELTEKNASLFHREEDCSVVNPKKKGVNNVSMDSLNLF